MRLTQSIAIAVLFATTANAQIVPGDSPNSGIGAAVANSRAKPLLGLSRGQANSEPDYQSRPAPPPSGRKPQGDPWAGIRQTTPASSSTDRHRAY